MPVSKVGRSLKAEPALDPEPIDGLPQQAPIDPIAEVFQADIARMAQHFWLSIVPQQIGPAIKDWIAQPENRAKFSKTLQGIGFCDFFEGPDSDSDGPLAMAAIETPALPEGPTP